MNDPRQRYRVAYDAACERDGHDKAWTEYLRAAELCQRAPEEWELARVRATSGLERWLPEVDSRGEFFLDPPPDRFFVSTTNLRIDEVRLYKYATLVTTAPSFNVLVTEIS